MKRFLLLIFSFCSVSFLFSQGNLTSSRGFSERSPAYAVTKPDMWEVGVQAGMLGSYGDIDWQPGWSVGLHTRKALDYLFSLRFGAQYGMLRNSDQNDGKVETSFTAGTIDLIIAINNIKWDARKTRRLNPYVLIGAGIQGFNVNVVESFTSELRERDWTTQSHMQMGGGIAMRVSERLNIGLESVVVIPFGGDADLLDGINRDNKDIINYTNLRFNFNLGNHKNKTEPMYWLNPMTKVMSDIQELKRRPKLDLTDKDKDGVVDMWDKDTNTPKGAPVDTHGQVLDSDNDGIPNYLDAEPFSSPGYKIDETGKAIRPEYTTKEEVEKLIEEALKKQSGNMADDATITENLINWLMPMVHFEIDSYQLREEDHMYLSNIASILKANPDILIVVKGFTDKTASDLYNNLLSYNRAKTVINYLVANFEIPRKQLILQYSGESETIISTDASNYINRRVEFKVARPLDYEMDAPARHRN